MTNFALVKNPPKGCEITSIEAIGEDKSEWLQLNKESLKDEFVQDRQTDFEEFCDQAYAEEMK